MNLASTSMENKTGQSCQMLFELFNEEMFGTLPDYMTKIMAQGPATMVLRESMRQATSTILNQDTEFKKWVTEANTMQEKINVCYELYGRFGYSFNHQVESEDSDKIVIKMTECPHIEFTKKNPAACSVCEGILLGILDKEFEVHLPRIHYEKCIAKGNDFCRYEIELK